MKALRQPGIARLQVALRQWLADSCGPMAASMSYYATLAFLPLLLILTSVAGYLLRFSGWGQDAQDRLLKSIAEQTSETLADQVREMLRVVEVNAGLGSQVGIVTLLVASLAMFVQFEKAFDRIWKTPPRRGQGVLKAVGYAVFHRLKAFVMLIALGGLIVITFITDLAISTVWYWTDEWVPLPHWVFKTIQVSASVVINWLLIALIYKAVPRVFIPFSAAARGALLATVTWEIGRQILSAYLIADKYSAYGVIGSLIAVMLWIYYAFAVLFLGAEYVHATCAGPSANDPNNAPRLNQPIAAVER